MARVFYASNPIDGKRQEIFYNKKQDKNELLQKVILDYWGDYCNENWLWLHKFEEGKWNHEDKVKRFLSTCATFLLVDSFGESNTLTKNAIDKIKNNEYSLDGNWGNNELEINPEGSVDFLNNYSKDKYLNDGKMLKTDFDNNPISLSKKKIESKTSRMCKIYSLDEKTVRDYEKVHISNTFNVWKSTTKKVEGRRGLIDRSKPYIAEWCIVDTENVFSFKDIKHTINKEVEQYNIREKKPRFDDYRNDYQMDKILVYEQDGERYYFDQDIYRIDNEMIEELNE